MSEREQDKVIELCVSIVQRELGEEVILQPVVKESLLFFLNIPTLEAKVGYIDYLLQLAVDQSAHLARTFFIIMMINASLEV